MRCQGRETGEMIKDDEMWRCIMERVNEWSNMKRNDEKTSGRTKTLNEKLSNLSEYERI